MNIAIIPLRSGSKALRNKNIKKFTKDILVNHTLKKVLRLKKIEKIFILTDSKQYKKKIIKNKKINCEYVRSPKLSQDKSDVINLIDDFLKWSKLTDKNSNIYLFQVTSPLWKINDIQKVINFYLKKKVQSLFTVNKSIESPHTTIFNNKNNWKYLLKKRPYRRQEFNNNYYFINGALYCFKIGFFKKYKKVFNTKTYAYEIPKNNFVDINEEFDFKLAKIIQKNINSV